MNDSSDDDEVKLVMKKFCKLLRKKEKVEDGPVCYECGEAGHIKNKCPKSGRNAQHFKRQRAYISWGGDSGDESSEQEEEEEANLCLIAQEEEESANNENQEGSLFPLVVRRKGIFLRVEVLECGISEQGFSEYLQQDPPQPNDDNDPLVAMVNQAWYHNNYISINYILEGLAETLYPVFAGAKLAKELKSSLNKKYQAEDAGTKKFSIGKMMDYKMVDSKSVVAQAEELTEDFQGDLKLKRTELNLEQLLTRLRIREEELARRGGRAKVNVVDHPSGSSHGRKDKKKICPKGGVSKFARKCYNCGITGHRSSDCKKKKPQKNKKKTTEAMCTELNNLDLYAVVTKLGEHFLKMQ
ncbi:unnamed protein product [Cuscuta campestris]|uniref:CCHC-type domain-containing protein n=1 Tax=Cuscuta campestris TaxID=132261 RepID=A0A484MMQ7_9ASTE|nr:unnamed protein product [Cuscuta campestris]